MYTWNALKDNVKINKDIVDNYRTMFESRIHVSSWSHDMEGHAKKCVERCCELANKSTQQTLQSIHSMHR